MKALLDKGADPNARLTKKVWYSGYNFDLSGVDEIGATPFWRAAYAADVDAMKLLVAHGADPNIRDDEQAPAGAHAATPTAKCRTSRGCRRFRSAGPGSRRCWRRPATATAKASRRTRTASRRAACSPP